MHLIKLNFFINSKFERVELFITDQQLYTLVEMRNDEKQRENLVTIKGSGVWFSPKDILYITELEVTSSWWENNAPDYYFENLKEETKQG